ncbi:hypothetical protein [Streptomyces sp. MJM8645]|uniref:hypothetical protein n=1 Tax=Streptomycetaceae TaxID=2062 RepID=UPI0007AF654A|nr:hypothetical protein [Streptomyces sp. MJM8645]
MRFALTTVDLQQLARTPADQAPVACLQLGRWGWSLGRIDPDRPYNGLIAIGAEALHERLAAGDTFTDLLAANDHWRLAGATSGQHPQVITGPHHIWQQARVVDVAGAQRIVAAGFKLLVTQDGQYVHIDSAGELSKLSELEAAQLVYRLPQVHEDGLPPALLAARHARRLVAALALPGTARTAQALAGARAAATVTELLRRTVARDVRTQRGIAAQLLVDLHGSRAVRTELGISKSTLSELLSGR